MADWNKPSSTDAYNNVGGVLDSLAQKDLDAARAFDDASTAPTNTPTGAMRLSTNERKFKWWDGSAWIEKITEFAINISGYAARLQTPRKINVTGGLTADGANFDGTAPIDINVTDIDLDKVSKAGTAAKANIGTGIGQLVPAEQTVFGAVGSGTVNVFPAEGGIGADAITKSGFYRANGDKGYALLTHIQHYGASSPNSFQFGTDAYGSTRFFARGQGAGVWTPNVEFWTTGNFDPAAKVDTSALGDAAYKWVESSYGIDTSKVMAVGAGGWLSKNGRLLNVDTNTEFSTLRAGGSCIYRNEGQGFPGYVSIPSSPTLYMSTIDTFGTLSIGYFASAGVRVFGGNSQGNWSAGLWGSHNFDPNTKVDHGTGLYWSTGQWYVAVGQGAAYEAPNGYAVTGIQKGASGNSNADVIGGVFLRAFAVN